MPGEKKRELRLGFAMGGGVSLGAFCGAALTEAIKLAIVRARYEVDDKDDPRHGTRVPYDSVVIDVFSGASAGAMSLLLMLRALADPAPAADTEARLRARFPGEYDRLSPERQAQLIAAQHAQDLQEQAWVRDINIERLLGHHDDGPRDLRHVPSVLDRKAVEDIAARHLRFAATPDFAGRRLLADRVLFAATLSNLTAVQYRAHTKSEAEDAGLIALRDALTSRGHREVRVFDLRFREAKRKQPRSRWVRYHNGDERDGEIGDLRKTRTWSRIGATCIACGAFPFAFEPVVLRRKEYEYGPRLWRQQFEGRVAGDEVRMTYVDGGTFNNEPIREAFRLASFMDSGPARVPFDRRVVFVDPRLGDDAVSFCVPVHTEWRLDDPGRLGDLQGYQLQRLTSLERLAGHAGSIAGAVLGEATRDEAHKVFAVRNRFDLRDDARHILDGALRGAPKTDDLRALIAACRALLRVNETDSEFPPVPYDLDDELERVIAEEPGRLDSLAGGAAAFLKDVDAAPKKELWLRALAWSWLDLVMDLEGKREESKVVAIAPIVRRNGELRYEPLPGHELFGFAGFTSEVSREFQVERARYCAELLMYECGLIDTAPGGPPGLTDFLHRDRFRRELETGMRLLEDRIGDVVARSHLPAAFRPLIAWYVSRQVRNLGRIQEPRRAVELRITVPDGTFELDGEGLPDRDRKPERIGDRFVLITSIDWRIAPDDGIPPRWTGPNVDEAKQTLRVDTHRSLVLGGDRVFCRIALPAAERVACLDDLAYPRFEITLKAGDKGKVVPAGRWEEEVEGVGSLEEGLHV